MLFLIMDMKRLMFASLFCSAMMAIFLKNNSNDHLILPQINTEPSISIAHFNLANTENDLETFTNLLDEIDAEVISLQEYTPFWQRVIDNHLRDKYPYVCRVVRIDPYGVALYSKEPFVVADTLFYEHTPSLKATLNITGTEMNIIASYISPSLDSKSTSLAENQLEHISGIIYQERRPVIVVGEFNDVYWSNKIKKFRTENRLQHSRRNVSPTSFPSPTITSSSPLT